jgi:hypothetical protein
LGYFDCLKKQKRRKGKKKEEKKREKPHVFQNSKMREVTFCKGAL